LSAQCCCLSSQRSLTERLQHTWGKLDGTIDDSPAGIASAALANPVFLPAYPWWGEESWKRAAAVASRVNPPTLHDVHPRVQSPAARNQTPIESKARPVSRGSDRPPTAMSVASQRPASIDNPKVEAAEGCTPLTSNAEALVAAALLPTCAGRQLAKVFKAFVANDVSASVDASALLCALAWGRQSTSGPAGKVGLPTTTIRGCGRLLWGHATVSLEQFARLPAWSVAVGGWSTVTNDQFHPAVLGAWAALRSIARHVGHLDERSVPLFLVAEVVCCDSKPLRAIENRFAFVQGPVGGDGDATMRMPMSALLELVPTVTAEEITAAVYSSASAPARDVVSFQHCFGSAWGQRLLAKRGIPKSSVPAHVYWGNLDE